MRMAIELWGNNGVAGNGVKNIKIFSKHMIGSHAMEWNLLACTKLIISFTIYYSCLIVVEGLICVRCAITIGILIQTQKLMSERIMNVSDTIHFYFAEQLIVSSTLNEIE